MAIEGGLRAYSSIAGGAGSAPAIAFNIASAESDSIFQGDPVVMEATGTVTAMSGVAEVAVVGVFTGCEYTDTNGQRQWSNKYTSTITADDTVAYVIADPNQLYKVKIATSDVDATLTQAAIGMNYDLNFAAGNATTGLSGVTLETVGGTAAAANVRLVGLTNDDGTDDLIGSTSTTYTHAIVLIDPNVSFWVGVAGI